MRIVKVGVLAPTNKGIPLGVQGENIATQVEFDTRPWFREYPHGTVSAVARRNGDPAPYPLGLDVADGTAVWQVSDTDTAKAGEGAVELTMTSAGARVRSLTFKTLVTASLTDSPVDDDAWYGWLDKAVVKVDETVQSAQRKMDEVDLEWTALKADVTEKVDECGEVAAQAASDAHHAKVDAQATAKALESAEGSVAKAEAAAKRAVDAMLDADDSAVEASRSALSAGESASEASSSADAAAKSAGDAATSASNAATSASSAAGSASAAEQSATDASNAKAEAQTAKAGAEAAKSEAATSASNAAASATAAAKSASDAADSVGAINVIYPKKVNTVPQATGYVATAVGDNAIASGQAATAIGTDSEASGTQSTAYGTRSKALGLSSVAVGHNSEAYKDKEFSVGYRYVYREITHVSSPTTDNSASTKKYTDDNDAKTLTEAKKYTDYNTSNALVGNVSGKLLHVEDAWPSKPVSLTIDGAYKQDGTPSIDAPVPIEVIENPVLHVLGRNLVDVNPYHVAAGDTGTEVPCYIPANTTAYVSFKSSNSSSQTNNGGTAFSIYSKDSNQGAHNTAMKSVAAGLNRGTVIADFDSFNHLKVYGYKYHDKAFDVSDYQLEVGGYHDYRPYTETTLPITMPAEHPYLAALPDGTHDEIVIDKYGNASLIARTGKYQATGNEELFYDGVNDEFYITNTPIVAGNGYSPEFPYVVTTRRTFGFATSDRGAIYMSNPGIITDYDSAVAWLKAHTPTFYGHITASITYPLGKVTVPRLPESISNVWTYAELTANMSMTYKRDINIAFGNLVQAVVAAAAGE